MGDTKHHTPASEADAQPEAQAQAFIARWAGVQLSNATELASSQTFVLELCALLGVPTPLPTEAQDYMFERPLKEQRGDGSASDRRIDCYKRGAFVWESKKLRYLPAEGRRYDAAMQTAHAQAQNYARALPAAEGRPPFVLVADIGKSIELYSEFSRSGGAYTPFPDPRSHRIALAELARPEVRQRLALIWTDPEALNPARTSARVTREVAQHLAELAKSLEQSGHRADHVAAYLTRCLFSMFAEDVELLPKGCFLTLLQTHRAQPGTVQHMLRILWADMDHGGFSAALAGPVMHFNGKLFKESASDGYSLLLNQEQIDQLIAAAKANWREVEPAIFGTLLERALSATERHALGAHYTPRAYVERLVLPTVVEPLRADWANAQAAAIVLANEGKLDDARAEVRRFHHQLCSTRVLDPACGSGNFLYVTLEHLKRLEGEVLNQLEAFGQTQDSLGLEGETVSLQQLRGIELNARAAAVAELVLWIGYLQWHIRTRGNKAVAEPVVHDYGNIECRDAVLAWDDIDLARDAQGNNLMRWDGTSLRTHPVTGAQVPDEAAQVPQWRYIRPRKAKWPQADFVVGNPPYLGARTIRQSLGEGYLEALRAVHPKIPDNADFVMYWWDKAAELVKAGKCKQFGLITTNSLRQTFNRAVLEKFAGNGLSITFAVPDHPWVDNANGAAVRVALSVGRAGKREGRLFTVTSERPLEHGDVAIETSEAVGTITAGLTIGLDIAAAPALAANQGMSCVGYQLTGKGFVVEDAAAARLLDPAFGTPNALVKPLLTGRDITQDSRGFFAIDLFGLDERELRNKHPAAYQRVYDRVKPERDQNVDSASNSRWWVFARPRQEFRIALRGCSRAVATSLTAKHRVFVVVPANTICDSTTVMFALPDGFHFGVLCSSAHVQWALASDNTLEDRPRYIKTVCFENFPFPDADTGLTPALRQTIATLAEQIDAHRKRQQAAHAGLTLTGMYNVLESLREGRPLTAKEKTIHDQGLVGVLKELHDELDAAVLQAYGWSGLQETLRPFDGLGAGQAQGERSQAALLERLVALNAQRAAEEKQGTVRWLRPEFQNPAATQLLSNKEQTNAISRGHQADFIAESASEAVPSASSTATQAWPSALPDQVRAVAAVLASASGSLSLPAIEAHFKGRGPWKRSLPRILETLQALGRARREGERWSG